MSENRKNPQETILTRKETEGLLAHKDSNRMEEETEHKMATLIGKRSNQMNMPALEALLAQHEESLNLLVR